MNSKGPFDPRQEAPLLSAYVDGELEAADVERIEEHLALPDNESGFAREEIARLRRLNEVTGALRLKEPPPEAWEAFWDNVYNRSERSLGWFLLLAGIALVGGWAVTEAVMALLRAEDLPVLIKGGVFALAAGVFVLLVSVVRERIYARSRTRYKDVIR